MKSSKKRSKNIKFFLITAFLFGVVGVIDLLAARERPVLMYHFVRSEQEALSNPLAVSETTFKNQIQWLKQWGFAVYSLDQLYDQLTGAVHDTKRGVALTFDDGNVDFINTILPILEKERVNAVNFVIWDNVYRREQGSMSVSDLKQLAKHPLITLGAHTMSHQELIGLPEQEMRSEILDSKNKFEREFKIPFHYFSYPSGFFDDTALKMVETSGYRMAFTTSHKRLGKRSETMFSRVRVKITEKDRNVIRFWFKSSGWHGLFMKLRHAAVQKWNKAAP